MLLTERQTAPAQPPHMGSFSCALFQTFLSLHKLWVTFWTGVSTRDQFTGRCWMKMLHFYHTAGLETLFPHSPCDTCRHLPNTHNSEVPIMLSLGRTFKMKSHQIAMYSSTSQCDEFGQKASKQCQVRKGKFKTFGGERSSAFFSFWHRRVFLTMDYEYLSLAYEYI